MKIKFLYIICSFCLLSTAYSQKLLSLYPLYGEQDAMLIPEIEGLWVSPDFDMSISFQKTGDNFYLMKYDSGTNESNFEAIFVKIKDAIFLDLMGVISDTISEEDYLNSIIKSHSFYKIEITKGILQLYELNFSWFYDYVFKYNLSLKYEWIENAMLLTLKTQELNSFFTEYNSKKEMFDNPISFIKKHIGVSEKNNVSKHDFEPISTVNISQKCIPEFPLKDGWLGGDGDVSVPINEIKTLFIFSDTYVGNRNQHSRQEAQMKMVSNTVAISECLPNGETDMEYFWNNMYSENPEPIFKSFTDRYKYWVNDAFMIKDNLYVVLEKIGPKLGASPNDIFNFSQLGYTLAKISNPYDTPNEWRIRLIPLNNFISPSMVLGPHVKKDNHIYFFVNRYNKAHALVRKQINYLDNTEKPFEYYALNKTWKEGLKPNDMYTVVNGFRSNSINYHPEIKTWVMICDIKFMENKIKMRTAQKLTGPWSGEIIIYEIPEVTPGNSSYNKSNFCYLARECIQNYDSENHVMVITYDINNSNISEIISNPKIYTPKVITIPLN